MATEELITNALSNFSDRSKTFAELIAYIFKDKLIEIYLGDSYEEVRTEQISTNYPSVFCGKVLGAFKECLIINCMYESDKKMKPGNILFINERSIRALTEVDNNGVIEDLFVRSRETPAIKKWHDK
jgi:hypothetical protein